MRYDIKSALLDILSEVTGIEDKKKMIRLLNNITPHKLDNHIVMCYNLYGLEKRKVDVGYYNSTIGDTDKIVSILSHLWKLAKQNKLIAVDMSVGNLIAVYKYDEDLYCAYDIMETEDKSIRVCENLLNYKLH